MVKDIKKILKDHEKWLATKGTDGSRADLSRADLRWADLSRADLRWADLRWADLRWADLREADLRWADLREADLREANLREANLSRADLREANLSRADLSRANLSRADLENVNNLFYPLSCPEKGSFVGFKKASNYIIELLIPEDALRSSATSRKCRCSKAKVMSITNFDGSPCDATVVYSNYDNRFIYKLGETVEVPDFDPNRWNECAPGIHFFITRQEAVNYI